MYKKNRRNRRRRNLRRRYSRKTTTFKKKVVRVLRSYAEKKYFNTLISAVSLQSTWEVCRPLALVVTGTGRGQRIGNQIKTRFINLRFEINLNASNTLNYRMIIVEPKKPTVYVNADLPGQNYIQIDLNKFNVLYDKIWNVNPGDLTNNPSMLTGWQMTIPYRRTINWEAGSTIPMRDVWVAWWSGDTVINSPILNATVTITFNDV